MVARAVTGIVNGSVVVVVPVGMAIPVMTLVWSTVVRFVVVVIAGPTVVRLVIVVVMAVAKLLFVVSVGWTCVLVLGGTMSVG